jgi:hypothetical protein
MARLYVSLLNVHINEILEFSVYIVFSLDFCASLNGREL